MDPETWELLRIIMWVVSLISAWAMIGTLSRDLHRIYKILSKIRMELQK